MVDKLLIIAKQLVIRIEHAGRNKGPDDRQRIEDRQSRDDEKPSTTTMRH